MLQTALVRSIRPSHRTKLMLPIRLLLAPVSLLLLAIPATAQTVRGVVVDEAARPVQGMLVKLVAPADGAAAGGALTDAEGRFSLAAPGPGRYTVRAERVGYAPGAASVDLEAGQAAEVRLTAAVRAFVLPALEVAAQRCSVRPSEDDPANALWEEARKALETAALLQDERRVEYTVRTFGRVTTLRTGRRERAVSPPRRVTGRPFHTLSPAELAAGGWVRQEGDSLSFYGPDAHALLSDEFLDTHCLYVDPERSDRHTVALAFQPVRERQAVDIQGALLLDRRTGELRQVEYEYTGLRVANGRVPARGLVGFQGLPSGVWIVSSWHISSTSVVQQRDWSQSGREVAAIAEIREAGGEVTDIVLLP